MNPPDVAIVKAIGTPGSHQAWAALWRLLLAAEGGKADERLDAGEHEAAEASND
jgi:hypothetical protein